MTMTCKINKLEKPGGQLRIFHTLFGRSAAFYGHFRADTVTSEWSTRISSSANSTKFYNKSSSRNYPEKWKFLQLIILEVLRNQNKDIKIFFETLFQNDF